MRKETGGIIYIIMEASNGMPYWLLSYKLQYILSKLAAGSGLLCTQAVSLITSELGCQLCLHTRAVNKEFQRVLKTLSTPCIALTIYHCCATGDGWLYCIWQKFFCPKGTKKFFFYKESYLFERSTIIYSFREIFDNDK